MEPRKLQWLKRWIIEKTTDRWLTTGGRIIGNCYCRSSSSSNDLRRRKFNLYENSLVTLKIYQRLHEAKIIYETTHLMHKELTRTTRLVETQRRTRIYTLEYSIRRTEYGSSGVMGTRLASRRGTKVSLTQWRIRRMVLRNLYIKSKERWSAKISHYLY